MATCRPALADLVLLIGIGDVCRRRGTGQAGGVVVVVVVELFAWGVTAILSKVRLWPLFYCPNVLGL